MALEMSMQNWQNMPMHIFPQSYDPTGVQVQEKRTFLNRFSDYNNYFEVPKSFDSPKSLNLENSYSSSNIDRTSKSIPINSDDKFESTFHWGTLDGPDERNTHAKSDDGVVLLVGLFNLFAVVAYAGQKILSGSSPQSENRAIYWQVQKALDELVLRVHSTDAAANLISRALKSSVHEVSGRRLNENSLEKAILHLISDNDHNYLKSTLNKIVNKLGEEISSAPSKLLGPRIDPKIYGPIKYLYKKIIEPSNQGREFSSSILHEVNKITRILSNMTLSEIKNTLKAMTQLGQLQRRYNIVDEIKNMGPSKVPKHYGVETVYDFTPTSSSSKYSRFKRFVPQYRNVNRFQNRMYNTRHPRYSKAGYLYKARRMKELNEVDAKESVSTVDTKSQSFAVKRQGPDNQLYLGAGSSWADGWFTLITQASPVGLDIITLYSRAKASPQCLRALMCKANGYWKKRGAFHAALSPFLSVLTSWGMENESPHSLGDSLIAIRAGWMGKHCGVLYPECGLNNVPHPLAEHALNFFTSVKKNRDVPDLASLFASKSGEIFDNQVDESHQLIDRIEHSTTTTPSTTTTTTTTTSSTTTTTTPTTTSTLPTTTTTQMVQPEDEEIPEEEYPYDRYDSPYFKSDYESLPSGSVTGMALQDRPLKRMSPEYDQPIKQKYHSQPPQQQQQQQQHHLQYHQPPPAPLSLKITSNIDKKKISPSVTPANRRYPPYQDPKHLYIKNPIDNISISRLGTEGGPIFLRQHDYSTYMASQRPAGLIKQGHRSIPYKNLPQESRIKSNTTPKTPKLKKRVKYKYGLRRGLPAHNVDGHSPLLETAANIRASKVTANPPSNEPAPFTYRPILPSKENPMDGKFVSHFGPTDAITDPFRNEMLYQFIRDRTLH